VTAWHHNGSEEGGEVFRCERERGAAATGGMAAAAVGAGLFPVRTGGAELDGDVAFRNFILKRFGQLFLSGMSRFCRTRPTGVGDR